MEEKKQCYRKSFRAQHTQTQGSRQRVTEDRFSRAQMEPEPGPGTERLSS